MYKVINMFRNQVTYLFIHITTRMQLETFDVDLVKAYNKEFKKQVTRNWCANTG